MGTSTCRLTTATSASRSGCPAIGSRRTGSSPPASTACGATSLGAVSSRASGRTPPSTTARTRCGIPSTSCLLPRAGPPTATGWASSWTAPTPQRSTASCGRSTGRWRARAGSTSRWTRCATCGTRATTATPRCSAGVGRTAWPCIAASCRRSATRSGRRRSCWHAGASGRNWLGSLTRPAWARTASATAASRSTTRTTTSCGGTIPTTSSSRRRTLSARRPSPH